MADDPTDKTPDAIKQHKPKQTLEMKTPDGASIRQGMANAVVEKDRERFSGNRAEKYANVEKEKLVTTKDMEAGTRGILSREHSKAAKDMER